MFCILEFYRVGFVPQMLSEFQKYLIQFFQSRICTKNIQSFVAIQFFFEKMNFFWCTNEKQTVIKIQKTQMKRMRITRPEGRDSPIPHIPMPEYTPGTLEYTPSGGNVFGEQCKIISHLFYLLYS